MRRCKSCGETASMMDSFDWCSFCLNDWLDKKALEKAPKDNKPIGQGRGNRKTTWDINENIRFDGRDNIRRMGAYPLYDGVK